MAWSVTFTPLQQRELISPSLCKCHSTFLPFKFRFPSRVSPFSSPKPTFQLNFSLFVAKAHVSSVDIRSSRRNHYTSTETTDLRTSDNNISSEFSSSRSNDKRVDRKLSQSSDSSAVEEGIGIGSVDNGRSRRNLDFKKIGNIAPGSSSMRSKDNSSPINSTSARRSEIVNEKPERKSKGGVHYSHEVKEKKSEKGSKKSTADLPEVPLRIRLDMCSKMGDVLGAISLYDSAIRDGVKMGQYHYTVLLYLCSSAAMGVIRPAKSGSGSRSLDMLSPFANASTMDSDHDDDHDDEVDDYEGDDDVVNVKGQSRKQEADEILVGEDVKKYAFEKGFEIYNKMCVENVPMNEAALTSVARMAMAMGDGDMAFNMVKQMKELGINPKLRSYSPALSAFCNGGHIEKAFAVEKHMLEHGVHPEEPELETLLRVSVEVGNADKVYHLLHKLRANVRSVSPSTADLIEKWFKSKEASGVGKRIWDHKVIVQMMEKVGGGWHGGGWLGRGKWAVLHTSVEANGLCKCCGEKLALIDLDPEETDRFAESVASIATKREKNSSFQKFQRWLDYYGPFEAVVDAANVGLFSQRRFKPSKVNAVANGIRQMNPSKKWPLIVLHNKRVTGRKMDEPVNKALIEKWRNADALYATPTGSNDDWYWLYAAVKFKCLIVTNDEMRDHTFQLLGTDFFPKWKERHQVRFSFSDVGPVFHMPPPCSVVIQESERGHWHIPIASNPESEVDRTWLCITRANACIVKQDCMTRQEGPEELEVHREQVNSNSRTDHQLQTPMIAHNKQKPEKAACRNLGKILSTSAKSSNCCSILIDIEAAEKLGSCMIDFQI